MWKESGVPEENARVQAGDHQSLSHTTTVDHGVRTGIAAVTTSALSTGLLGYLILQLEVDLIEMCIFRISRYISHNCYFKNTFFYDVTYLYFA